MKKYIKDIKNKEDGFTIIEVMIVLAIAGLIMLVVFLAVPALQRNSRNTQRQNDAARMAAAVNECVINNNGRVANCQSFTAPQLSNYYDLLDNQQLQNPGAAALDGFSLEFNSKCDATGQGVDSGQGGSRAFTISYEIETQGTGTQSRCLGS